MTRQLISKELAVNPKPMLEENPFKMVALSFSSQDPAEEEELLFLNLSSQVTYSLLDLMQSTEFLSEESTPLTWLLPPPLFPSLESMPTLMTVSLKITADSPRTSLRMPLNLDWKLLKLTSKDRLNGELSLKLSKRVLIALFSLTLAKLSISRASSELDSPSATELNPTNLDSDSPYLNSYSLSIIRLKKCLIILNWGRLNRTVSFLFWDCLLLSFLGSLVLSFLLGVLVNSLTFVGTGLFGSKSFLTLLDFSDSLFSESFLVFRSSSLDLFDIVKSDTFDGSLFSEHFLLLVLALIGKF